MSFPVLVRSDGILGRKAVGCPKCRRAYLVVEVPARCPMCGGFPLQPQTAVARDAPPELLIPFHHGRQDLVPKLEEFARGWFRPSGLNGAGLAANAVAVWWPAWLVDATAKGTFEADVGFNYEVKSSEESYDGGRWVSHMVMRTKIRWEPRVGTVQRRYDNVVAPALAEADDLIDQLGRYDLRAAIDFTADKLEGALLRLPDVDPAEAWASAETDLVENIGADCRDAVKAQHVRGVSVSAEWEDARWTWLLLPMYATWYADDAGNPRVVLIHGQTGQPFGPRVASLRKALLWAGVFGSIGAALLGVALLVALTGLLFPPLLVLALLFGILSLPAFVAAVWAPIYAWGRR